LLAQESVRSAFDHEGGAVVDANIGSPAGMAFDASGNFYYCDFQFCVIRGS
jgi:sugar lactone lactonase YvrE